MPKRKKAAKRPTKPLDTLPGKRGRGRPRKVIPSEVSARAYNYRWIFNQVWDRLWPLLSRAQTEEEVIKAFEQGASPYDKQFMPALASLVLKVLRELDFPDEGALVSVGG